MKNNIVNNIRLLYLFNFLSSLRFDRALWILYLGERGLNMSQVGLIESLFHIAIVLFEVPTGMVADLYGRRKSLLIGSLLSLLYAVFMMIGGHFFIFALAFAFSGLAGTFRSGADQALLYDTLESAQLQARYTKINGNLMAISLIAMSVSQWLGGVMAKTDWNLVYVSTLIFGGLLLVPVFFIKEPVKPQDSKSLKKESVLQTMKKQFIDSLQVWSKEQSLRLPLILYVFLSCAIVIVMFYGQEYFSRLGFSTSYIGFIFTVESLMGIGAAKLAYGIEKRWAFGKVLVFVYLMICISLVFFAIVSGWSAVVIFFILGNLSVMLDPIFSNFVQMRISSGQRATFFSFISLATSLGIMVFFPAFGFLVDLWNFSLAFTILAGAMTGLLVSLKLFEERLTSNPLSE